MTNTKTIIGVVGAGTMGRGIAQVAAAGGFDVVLTDANAAAVADAQQFIAGMLKRAEEKGTLPKDAAAAAIARIRPAATLDDLKPCGVVIEAVAEDLAVKRKLFAELEAVVSADCILASNTSALPITSIAAACKRPARIAGTHFFNPVPLMKLVEVIDGLLTDAAVAERLVEVTRQMGRTPVRCRDFPGFLAGNIGRGYTLEAARLVQDGVGSCYDIDKILREAVGFPMGPFELIDNNGADIVHRAMESVYADFYQEPYFRPSPMLGQRVAAGLLGRKTGRGFYPYEDRRAPARVPDASAPTDRPQAVWVSADQPEGARALGELLARLSANLESGPQPSSRALCFVTPVGEDATGTCTRLGLDARRTVAVDTLFGLDKRRTCMTTPATSPESARAAHGLLASDGVPVTMIGDSPGFVAQRVVAMIVNIGCWIAQSQYATPSDVDLAARLGLGYPMGPCGFADALGAPTIVRILDAVYARTRDPRYRASGWLLRRAQLGLPASAE
jgi:3-hydroxybutyryl-CoA dehydrogenase